MTIGRAKVNCERCYALTQGMPPEAAYHSDAAFAARDTAVAALERVRDAVVASYRPSFGDEIAVRQGREYDNLINECATCDHKEPHIANAMLKLIEDAHKEEQKCAKETDATKSASARHGN